MTPFRTRAALVLGASVVVAACSPDRPEPGQRSVSEWRGSVLAEPVPKAAFTLTDTDGQEFDFVAETEGDLTLLFFGYTSCPDICPVHLANLAAVMRDFSWELRDGISVVFVSTDPGRDTPERVREWLDAFDRSFVGLVGTTEQVNAIERSLGLPPSVVAEPTGGDGYLVAHAAQILAFTADGFAHLAYPFGVRQEDWARDLPRLVRQGFRARPDA